MNGKDRIDRINKMATAPEEYRARWKPQAERAATEVEAEIARLRTFAKLKPGVVANHCNGAADWLEAELQEAMAKFEQKTYQIQWSISAEEDIEATSPENAVIAMRKILAGDPELSWLISQVAIVEVVDEAKS